jgi:hypothetical protein
METRVRLLIVLAGLPEPKVNMIVRITNGKWRWRFDLCYPEYKLIIEYDGRRHHTRGHVRGDAASNWRIWPHSWPSVERREEWRASAQPKG